MEDPTKPTVKLTGIDGNAFSIMGEVKRALKKAGRPREEIQEYLRESMAGDYNNLLAVVHKYVNIH